MIKKLYIILILIFLINTPNYGQDLDFSSKYTLNFSEIEVIDLAVFYSRLTFKTVFVDSRLRGKMVNIHYASKLSRVQSIEILNQYLLVNGIMVKESKEYITFSLIE